ncbi:MAG: DHH family phosphoesterase [Candidatus Saccharimonadales bacterium]
MKYPEANQISEIIGQAQKIVILQADNPDGDSLASALALEHILGDMGKQPYLYCGVDMPAHLRHLPGWDRVNKDLPNQFDASIVVDTSSEGLFETLQKTNQRKPVASRPCIVLDHHATKASIGFATVLCIQKVVATGELIYELANQLDWPLSKSAKEMIAASIMSDSLGLTSEGTGARSIHIIGEVVEAGVSLAKLEALRRDLMRKSPELTIYKGALLQRVEYHSDDRVATVTIPWEEIQKYSPIYNPSILVMDDMRMTERTDIAIAFKVYRDGKITAKIRANYGIGIADKLAETFGGGGHRYASGFKVSDGRPFNEVKSECIKRASELLDNLTKENSDETP